MSKDRKKIAGHKSWLTTDAEEVDLRRQRAASEPMAFERLGTGKSAFANYEVWRTDQENARRYTVELRSLDRLENSCTCFDYRKNRLGTCKHVEKIAAAMAGSSEVESPLIEVFLEHRPDGDVTPRVNVPARCPPTAREFMSRYLGVADRLKKPEATTLSVLIRNLRYAPAAVKSKIRVSSVIHHYVEESLHREKMNQLRDLYADQLRKDAGKAAFLKHALYDYQIDGMLHLAFTGRALLADEMGLGKTVQAIAAARVLHDLHDIRRVLVVCPTSLKAEWEDQIRKFTDLPSELVLGGRKERLLLYRDSKAFFLLSNYEQIVRDWQDINELLHPDLVILDEAQRIKNWKTKTARHIKDLTSRFAFVLTGTPLENRIDELYSLVDFIDPTLFGSLFQFNRQFYNFDGEGKTAGFKNLAELHRTTAKVMLRRRKDQIQEQLPERIDNNYFVPMTPEQTLRYDDHATPAARIMSAARRRPLSPAEHESLQRHLACMRMLCDTCHILDEEITESPKADELRRILADLWDTDPGRKVIVFSEWVRMLELVQADLAADGISYALHTGSVPQKRRRDEIKRFKEDPDCRVFLSSDSGGVGLNLQNASVVVNLDLPWNPAKLEQRIARAWRKHQRNAVNVINLVAENTIEQRMLATLSFKQGLADAVLDARGDLEAMEQPGSRSQFMERLAAIMDTNFTTAAEEPEETAPETAQIPEAPRRATLEQLGEEIAVAGGAAIGYCAALPDGQGGAKSLFVVADDVDKATGALAETVRRNAGGAAGPELLVIDAATSDLLDRLAAAGVITLNTDAMRKLIDRSPEAREKADPARERRKQIDALIKEGERKYKMGSVLAGSGFSEEAVIPFVQAGRLAGRALAGFVPDAAADSLPAELDAESIAKICGLPEMPIDVPLFLHAIAGDGSQLKAPQLAEAARRTIDEAEKRLMALSI